MTEREHVDSLREKFPTMTTRKLAPTESHPTRFLLHYTTPDGNLDRREVVEYTSGPNTSFNHAIEARGMLTRMGWAQNQIVPVCTLGYRDIFLPSGNVGAEFDGLVFVVSETTPPRRSR